MTPWEVLVLHPFCPVLFFPAISMHASPVRVRVLVPHTIRCRVPLCVANVSRDDLFCRPGALRRAEITRRRQLGPNGALTVRFRVRSGTQRAKPVGLAVRLRKSSASTYCAPRNSLRVESYARSKCCCPVRPPYRGKFRPFLGGAIIPALMHRIPSELRS